VWKIVIGLLASLSSLESWITCIWKKLHTTGNVLSYVYAYKSLSWIVQNLIQRLFLNDPWAKHGFKWLKTIKRRFCDGKFHEIRVFINQVSQSVLFRYCLWLLLCKNWIVMTVPLVHKAWLLIYLLRNDYTYSIFTF
jgi:hypothetical protein